MDRGALNAGDAQCHPPVVYLVVRVVFQQGVGDLRQAQPLLALHGKGDYADPVEVDGANLVGLHGQRPSQPVLFALEQGVGVAHFRLICVVVVAAVSRVWGHLPIQVFLQHQSFVNTEGFDTRLSAVFENVLLSPDGFVKAATAVRGTCESYGETTQRRNASRLPR